MLHLGDRHGVPRICQCLFIAVITFLICGTAKAGFSDWFYGESWEFMQSVGGIAIGTPSRNPKGTVYLPIKCDVSGLTAITKKPTTLNSALAITRIDEKIEGKQIYLSVFTGLVTKNEKTTCSEINLGEIPAGNYQVFYCGSDRQKHSLGEITVSQNAMR